ncbi:MAG TPA: ABC transporter permease [Gammaproteobacteria bacterium]|nr:ABC transporter permease [Gammaproteobacteria bacterium]
MNVADWARDLRYALRQLARAPGFTAVAVLTLSIGIGANTAIFSVVNELLLRPPAHVVEPERIVSIWTSDFSGPPYGASSYPDYETFRQQRDVMADVAAYGLVPGNLVEPEETVRLAIEQVTSNYFDVLGVRAALGRLLGTEADVRATVVVLGHSLWRDRFGADPGIVDRTVRINDGTFTVVGVAPEGFKGSQRIFGGVDAWVPLEAMPGERPERLAERGSRGLLLLGRLQPGVSLDAARASYAVVANQLLASYPEEWRDVTSRGRAITILPESESRVPPELRGAVVGFFGLLLAGFALVLLICCVNVANLLLARAAGRVRDIAIRVSLGASRTRLVRQLMIESVALAALGCAGAVLVTYAAARLLARWQPPGDLKLDVAIDWRVLVFALVAAVVAAAIFGLAPALNLTRLGASSALKEGALAVAGQRRFGLRGALIAAQVSVSLVLLVCAGLFLRSLQQAATVDLGLDADNVVVASFDLRTQGYSEPRGRAFYAELTERVAGLPGVRAVTLAQRVPLSGDGGRRRAGVEGYEPQPGEDMEFNFNVVGPEYFDVMRVPLVNGRGFTASDREGAPQVAVVNETFAARYWPGQDPIGKRLTSFSGATSIEIVGVARDGKYQTLTEAPLPYIYRPFLQDYEEMTLHVRLARDTGSFLPLLRREIRAVDSQLPILRLASMRSATAFATWPQRIAATLLGACAALALLLAAVGLYGVVAYAVSRRTREIGIRMALGAGRHAVVRMVLAGSMKVVAIGLTIGFALSLAAGRAIESFLGDVSSADPVALVAAPLVMIACALVASWLPARRAARIDPMKALREE